MSDSNSEKLLSDVRAELNNDGVKLTSKQDQKELMEKFILPALESSKDIQRHLYSEFTTDGNWLRGLKNKVIRKIANITRNTVEKSFMRQQKFNDNLFKLSSYLLEENKHLRKEMAELKKRHEK
jgi:hypothetical protein